MKMKKMNGAALLCVSLSLVLCFGCRGNKPDEGGVPVVSIDISSAEAKDLQGRLEIVDIVELETTPNSLVSEYFKADVGDEYILTKGSGILLWGRDGRFIREIGRQGNGPDEYDQVWDVQLDEAGQKIYIHDWTKQRMMVYDLNGELQSNIYKELMVTSFCKTDDGYWVYVPSNWWPAGGYALMLLDNDFDKVKGEFLYHEVFPPSTFEPRFSKDSNGEYYFTYPFSNIIYHLKDGEPRPWLKVDFGKNTLPYDEIRKMTDVSSWDQLISEKKYMGDIYEVVFGDGMMAFNFDEEVDEGVMETYSVIYDTTDGYLELCNEWTESVSTDPDSRFPIKSLLLWEPVAAVGDLWVYAVEPGELGEEDLEMLRERVSPSISEDSNPLLFFVRQGRKK